MKTPDPEKIMSDLYRVGPDKPLGYLPLSTIRDICGRDVEQLRAELAARGLKTIVKTDAVSQVYTGALYAYDERALGDFLSARKNVLRGDGWPETAEEFIAAIDSRFADTGTDMFDLIADAYADKDNGNRKDRGGLPRMAHRRTPGLFP